MQAIGNLLTIIGIVVTLVSYFGQHRGVSLSDLEPALVARWRAARAWIRRRLGRTHPVNTGRATGTVGRVTMSATGLVWSPIQPGDDIAIRADKLARNLDALRANVQAQLVHDRQRVREIQDGLSTRLTALDQLVATRHEESKRAETVAMRWELRGLLITLVGTGLTIVGG